MKIITKSKEVFESVADLKRSGRTVGFVPTMGALHRGHLSLVKLASSLSDVVVMSIFVNPTQFNSSADLEAYPRTFENDCALARAEGVDIIFAPDECEMYPDGKAGICAVRAGSYSEGLCGATRPGHFDGVVTIVAKLFNVVSPDIALFGEKDFQQLKVIQQMVDDLNFPVKIIPGALVREENGLALSSRNERLSGKGKEAALSISRSLFEAKTLVEQGEIDASLLVSRAEDRLKQAGLLVDYVEIVDRGTLRPVSKLDGSEQMLIAAFCEEVRLIDNLSLQ